MPLRIVGRNKAIENTIIVKKMAIFQEIALNFQKTSIDLDNIYANN